jgi:two-component system, response regulator YesN
MYKLLIVDDEPNVCKGLSTIIEWEKYGFTLTGTANDGEEALDKLKIIGRCGLVITDIRMPVIDGLELTKRICSLYPATRVVIISGYNDFDYARQAIQYGVKGYLLKPIDREELVQNIEKVREELDNELNYRRINLENNRLLADRKKASGFISDLQEEKSNHTISQIKRYVEKNYSTDLSLKSIAAMFYMNPVYLGRLFKATVGESFSDYVNKIRIAEIKRMVFVEKGKIYDMIKKVGFSNHEYFYRLFKRYEGRSFADYKENLKTGKI